MNYKLLTIVFIFASQSVLYPEIKNPFGPVGEKILSKQVFFNNQSIEELNLIEITDTEIGKKALVKGKEGIGINLYVGDFIGIDSGKIILIDRDRVVVLVREKAGGKNVIRIEILK